MSKEEILKKHVPGDCWWLAMDHLTNTPVKYIYAAMEEYKYQGHWFTPDDIRKIQEAAYEAGYEAARDSLTNIP